MSQLTLAEGSIFAGRYQVVRCIAMGGMGAVYEVLHIETDRRRALKVMLPHVVGSEELRSRFRQEARVAAHIESEYIVDVFDAGVDEATQMPFLVMELLRGEEIGKRLKRVGRFDPREVIAYLQQTAFALDKTHRASIVHRDLKPENLFLMEREDGQTRVKVLDFGIAKLVADASTQANATRSLGTPLYMAPEQFRTSGVSTATDIYSLGMVAFTLLVGKTYWLEESQKDNNVFAFAAIAVHGPPEPATLRARRRGVELPPAFDTWFARMTAVNPAARFPSAGEAVRAMAEALGYPLAARSEAVSDPQIPLVAGPEQSGPLPHVSGQSGPQPRVSGQSGPQPAISGQSGPTPVTAGQSGPLPENNTASGAVVTTSGRQRPGRRTKVAISVAVVSLAVGGTAAFFVVPHSSTVTAPAGAQAAAITPAAEPSIITSPKDSAPTVQVTSGVASEPPPVVSAPASASVAAPAPPIAAGSHPGVLGGAPRTTPTAKPSAVATAKIWSRD